MKQHIEIGVVCLARVTFDYIAANEIYQKIISDLEKIENITFHIYHDLLFEVGDAKKAAEQLGSKNIDGLIVISGTFHLGHLALELDKLINKPILLWGLNELPYDGGKIRLNSVCGINLDASNLYKSGNTNYHYIVSEQVDNSWLDALRISKALSTARIGILGYRAHGFFNLSIDEPSTYSHTGAMIDHFELCDVYNTQIDKTSKESFHTRILNTFDVSNVNSSQVLKVSELCAKFNKFMRKNELTALAVRCWPEFAMEFGISPCASMSILQAEGHILGCEGDIDGVLSMIAHKAVGAQSPFLADLSQVDINNNSALLWHCGVAPCNLWDEKSIRSLDTYFAGGKGVTADFVLKGGEINVLRFDSTSGKYRIFSEKGVGMPMNQLLKGTYLKVRFETPIKEVLDRLVYNGIAHHVSMVYGDYTEAIKIFARLKHWETV